MRSLVSSAVEINLVFPRIHVLLSIYCKGGKVCNVPRWKVQSVISLRLHFQTLPGVIRAHVNIELLLHSDVITRLR